MSEADKLLQAMEATGGSPPKAQSEPPAPRARIKPVDRNQTSLMPVDVEGLIEEDHPARAIWEFVDAAAAGRRQMKQRQATKHECSLKCKKTAAG
jgi:hypothetical protein